MLRFLPFIGLFLWAACAGEAPKTPANPSETTTTAQPSTVGAKKVRFKMSFIGDIMGHGDQITAAFDPATKTHDYEPTFRYVLPIFEQDDLTVGNLELTLNNRGVYTGYPRFRSPDILATAIKNASFELLSTANNHSNDDDRKGIVHTLDVLDSLKIAHTGTFRDSAERERTYPYILEREKDGVKFKFAFLCVSYGTNGIPTQAPSVVNLIDTAEMLRDIEKAKAQNPDMIIALVHWGNEYQLNESTEQRRIANFLYRHGVPVVIGGHPHVIQPVKIDTFTNAKGEKETGLCTYSLGNFVSNQNQKNTDTGLLFELELEKNTADGKTTIIDHSYIILWRYIYGKHLPKTEWVYTVVPSAAFEQDSTNFLQLTPSLRRDMLTSTENMRRHLAKFQSKERRPSFEDITKKATRRVSE